MKKKSPARKKINFRAFKVGTGLTLILIFVWAYYFFFSREWSLYLYSLNNKGRRAYFVGEYSTEDACMRKGRDKVTHRISLDKNTLATEFLCGKYCLEVPALELSISDVHCSSVRGGYNGEILRK